MQNTSYVLVPYQEYQELLALKKEATLQKAEQIFFQDAFSILNLSRRLKNWLSYNLLRERRSNNKIIYLGELVTLTERQLFCMRGIGKKGVSELRLELKSRGFSLYTELDKVVAEKLEELKSKTN